MVASLQRQIAAVFPTPVGVFPSARSARSSAISLPHARGGVSSTVSVGDLVLVSSPRPWGCFPFHLTGERHAQVFPTPVGVFLHPGAKLPLPMGLPHARGGVSASQFLPPEQRQVFPTPVGVFLRARRRPASPGRLPHARGGVSIAAEAARQQAQSSPRPWGCFQRRQTR